MTIGKILKRLRNERGLSQRQLSIRADVSQQLISQIENEVNFSTKNLPKIAKALGVPVSDIDVRYDDATKDRAKAIQVPILSPAEIIAGAFTAPDGDYVALSDLEPGDWIAMEMTDDAMDRVAPAGALVVVNRSDKALEEGGLYLLSTGRDVICRRYRSGASELLLPFSINPEHIAEAFDRQRYSVIGRCRRSVLEI